MAKKGYLLLLAGLFVFITACQAEPTPTPTITNVSTKQFTVTKTLWPTITAALTATPFPPTPTIEPGEILQEHFADPQIKVNETFSNLNAWLVWDEESINTENAQVTLTGQPDWNSALVYKTPIRENQGVILTYKAINNVDSKAEFVFVSGEFKTPGFRQFGIYNGTNPKSDLYQGANGIGFTYLHGNYAIRKDTWQTLIMAVDDQGKFISIISNPENPQQKYQYLEKPGETWKEIEWEFRVTATESEIIVVKGFQHFTFSEILK